MPEENVELVRRVHDEWARGRMSAGVEHFHPAIRFESFMPDSDERFATQGPDGIEAFMRGFLAQWRGFRITGDEFVEVPPDKVVASGRQCAVGRASGIEVEDEVHSVWTIRRGQVVGLHFERDRDRAYEAAGG